MISEVRSRGLNGGYDCFVELFNPTSQPVVLDNLWALTFRKATYGTSYQPRWAGSPGLTIPAGGFFLIANPGTTSSAGYDQSPQPDAWMETVKVPDAGGVQLIHDGVVVDSLCYYDDAVSLNEINDSFSCEGTPVLNPHSFSATTNTDESLHRKQNGCQDTGDSESDFETVVPSTPTNSAGDSQP